MGFSLKPLVCNGKCAACYENKIREAMVDYHSDYEAMLETWKKVVPEGKKRGYTVPVLHGGEPLLIPIHYLEQFLEVVYREYGRTSVQTNGVLLNEAHLRLFKRYNTSVGVSIDGPSAEMNYGRWNASGLSMSVIQALTDRTLRNIEKAKGTGLSVSIITLLRKYNATGKNLKELKRFALEMAEKGIRSVRFNPVVVHDKKIRAPEELSGEEYGKAVIYLCEEAYKNPSLDWRPCKDVIKLLQGDTDVTCTFLPCDPYYTEAEIPVLVDGGLGNCMHGAADGLQPIRAESKGLERYEILPQVPQDVGGCKGCKWWNVCTGGCPGAGIDNDWRNKTRFCEGYKMIFEDVERRLKAMGVRINLKSIKVAIPGGNGTHGDSHGDRPHGDHTDGGR